MKTDLKELQTLLHSAITAAPDAARAPHTEVLSGIIRGDDRLSAPERLNIYADAYFYRLLGCLTEDFPATAAVAGEEPFQALIRSYLVHYPPTQPSIFHAGRHLANFIRGHELQQRWPWLAELAGLERTLIEVFHDADATPLTMDEMSKLAPAAWPEFALRTIPALRQLDCAWRVSDVVREVEGGHPPPQPAHEPTVLLVWRQDTQVYYRDLKAAERNAVALAANGTRLADLCEAFASQLACGEDATDAIGAMLSRWIGDGLLVPAGK